MEYDHEDELFDGEVDFGLGHGDQGISYNEAESGELKAFSLFNKTVQGEHMEYGGPLQLAFITAESKCKS